MRHAKTPHEKPHEIDVVASQKTRNVAERVIATGGAKWRSTPGDIAGLNQLTHISKIMHRQHPSAAKLRLLLFSGCGFTTDVQQAANASNYQVQLIDLERLYTGE